jgi:hypothetical protein
VKLQHLKKYLNNSRSRARRDNVPFNLTLQDLVDIATDECPILHTPFVWGISGLGKGKTRPDSPTLDRILPELGYIKGNVAFLSYRANRIKDNGTMQEHYDIADWIWNHTHANKKPTTPVPAGTYIQGAVGAELGSLSTPWTWEDDDNAHHHCGADAGQDADHRAQESSGNGVGRGGQEVGAPTTPEGEQDDWQLHPAYGWIKG